MTGSVATQLAPLESGEAYLDARDLIRRLQPVEPAYLFCENSLRHRANRFQRGFPGAVAYAVKANPEPRVLRALVGQGLGHFDVASLAEVRTARALCPGAILHFNNPVKAAGAIAEAYSRYGVRSFALDERAELEKIRQATGGDPRVMYSVRIRLAHEAASYDFGSKFGATPAAAVELLRRVVAIGARPALTFHPGSQCTEPSVYARYLEAAAGIVQTAGVEPALVNVGGGFPEQYVNSRGPRLEEYFGAIGAATARYFHRPPPLLCEPGRGMVASAVSLLSRVIHVREDQRTLFVNDGVYGGMQEQSLVDLRLPVRAWKDDTELAGACTSYRIFGPTCDPIDRLPRELMLPEGIEAGDYIEFGLLGAYGSATSTAFNGFQSAAYFNVERGF